MSYQNDQQDQHIQNQTVSQDQAQDGVQRGNAPRETLWDGALKNAIFENRRPDGTVNYSVEPGRIYKDREGNVRESKSLSGAELLRMAELNRKSYDRINEFRQEMKAQNRNQDQGRSRSQ